VYGWTNTSFSIMASLNTGWQNPITLLSGQPQTGNVGKGAYNYYQFYMSPDLHAPTIHFVLMPTDDQDQDLYVTTSSDREPGKTQYDFKATSWDMDDEVMIAPTTEKYCTDCTYYLAVYGYEDGEYQIGVSLSNDQTGLQLGIASRATLGSNAYAYYKVDWQSVVDDLVLSLTPESGRPLLYASCKSQFPNASSHSWSLDSQASQLIRLNSSSAGAAGCSFPGKLYVSVFASNLSSFTIMASSDASSSVPLLTPGVQISGDTKYSRFKYYQVRVGNVYADVNLIVSVRTGEVDLYVSESYDGRPQYDEQRGVYNYTLKSDKVGDDSIRISRSSFKPCTTDACYYLVGVFGRDYTKNEFTIVAKFEDNTITLQDSVAIRDVVGPRMYEYFKIKVVDPDGDLTISVTPFSGDPDLYISPAPEAHPRKENYTWASRGFGGDTLTLQAEDMRKYCTPDSARGVGCDIYIGVYGWTNTSFSIMASLNMGWMNPIVLFSGQPQSGHVHKGTYDYYQFTIPGGPHPPQVRIALNPTEGSDQDLYLTTSRDHEPGKTQYDMRSTSWAGVDEIVLQPGTEHYTPDNTVYVAVFGYQEGDYQISASTSTDHMTLQMGVPLQGSVPRDTYAYYSVDWQSMVDDLVLTVTPQSGKPHVFASCVQPFPNITVHSWALDTLTSQILRINATEATKKGCVIPALLYVSMHADSLSTYTVMVSTDAASSVPMLVPGVPVSGDVKFSRFQYYQVRVGASYVDVDVLLSVRSGEVDLYVSDSYEGRPQWDPVKQEVYNYTLSSENDGNDRIVIPHSHFKTCTTGACYYIIGTGSFGLVDLGGGRGGPLVFSNLLMIIILMLTNTIIIIIIIIIITTTTIMIIIITILLQASLVGVAVVGVLGRDYTKNEFNIVVKKVESTVSLQDGVAVKDFVGPKQYEYFRIMVVDEEADLTIAVTPFTGDPDLYIAVLPNYHPTKENHTWASRGFGADTLTLQAEAMKQHCTPDLAAGVGCEYYIGTINHEDVARANGHNRRCL
jgi:hypothetical protein